MKFVVEIKLSDCLIACGDEHQRRKRRFSSALTAIETRQDQRAARPTVATPAKAKTRTAVASVASIARHYDAPNVEDARRNGHSILNRVRMTKLSPISAPTRNHYDARHDANRYRRVTLEDALCATGRTQKTPLLPPMTIMITKMTTLV